MMITNSYLVKINTTQFPNLGIHRKNRPTLAIFYKDYSYKSTRLFLDFNLFFMIKLIASIAYQINTNPVLTLLKILICKIFLEAIYSVILDLYYIIFINK
jgi:hypothetical protein